jgi:hypothetical protein
MQTSIVSDVPHDKRYATVRKLIPHLVLLLLVSAVDVYLLYSKRK